MKWCFHRSFFFASQENREMLVTISCIQSQRVLWVAIYRKKNDTRKTLLAPNFHQLPRFVEKTTSIPQPFTVFSTESSFPWPKKQGHKTWPSAHQPRFSGDFTISEGKNVEHTLFSFHGVPEVEKLVESWSAWSIGGVWFCNKFQMS